MNMCGPECVTAATEQNATSSKQTAAKPATENKPAVFSLPMSVLLHAFSFLDGQSAAKALSACTEWNNLPAERKSHFWRSLCHRDFSSKEVIKPLVALDGNETTWRTRYSLCSRLKPSPDDRSKRAPRVLFATVNLEPRTLRRDLQQLGCFDIGQASSGMQAADMFVAAARLNQQAAIVKLVLGADAQVVTNARGKQMLVVGDVPRPSSRPPQPYDIIFMVKTQRFALSTVH